MNGSKRVLYVGQFDHPGSTALHRMLALEQLGLSVTSFDTNSYQSMSRFRIVRSGHHRLALGAPISGLNRDLGLVAGSHEFDWVWIDKGVWVTPETLASLAASGSRLIHYAGDPMILFHRTRHFVASIPFYDVLITTKSYEMELYRSLGARRLVLQLHGYDAELFRPLDVPPRDLARFASDVCFVGHCEPDYRRRVSAAAETGADVAIWGKWQRAAMGRPQLRKLVRGSGVWGEDYVKALNATKIGLGLLTKYAPDGSTTRSFEIPACGTLFLAERSPEHLELFEEGKEAEFFDTDGEMKEKISWYLEHEEERRRIAAAGRAKSVQAGYSYLERMRSALDMIG
jgi:spore maturation protein CgeB